MRSMALQSGEHAHTLGSILDEEMKTELQDYYYYMVLVDDLPLEYVTV